VNALDTNVLVRYLVLDDAEQAERATALVEGTAARGEKLLVVHVVLCELVWVLASAYRRPRTEIARTLSAILRTAQFVVEDVDVARRALARYEDGRGDFADYLVSERARVLGTDQVATFENVLLVEDGFFRP